MPLLVAVVFGAVWCARPIPPRLRRLAAVDPSSTRDQPWWSSATQRCATRPVLPLAGLAACALALAWSIGAIVLLAAALAGAGVVWRARSRRVRRERSAIACELPDVVDLLLLTTEAGLGLEVALRTAVDRLPAASARGFSAVLSQVARGELLSVALLDLDRLLGPEARPLARALAGAARDGVPLVPTLERLADQYRTERRRSGEAAARRVPVRLLFPLVLLVLPAFALLTVVPVLAGTLHGMRPT